jgi:hypothetical protein
MEKDLIPPTMPLWFKAEWVAKAYPTKENLDLSSWCQNTEGLMAQTFRDQQAWNSSIKSTNCTFLLGPNGDIQDAFVDLVFRDRDTASEEFALSTVSKAGPFPAPPKYLANRRLKLWLHYPKVELFVDFHDDQYFQGMKTSRIHRMTAIK